VKAHSIVSLSLIGISFYSIPYECKFRNSTYKHSTTCSFQSYRVIVRHHCNMLCLTIWKQDARFDIANTKTRNWIQSSDISVLLRSLQSIFLRSTFMRNADPLPDRPRPSKFTQAVTLMCPVRLSVGAPTLVTEVYCGFPHSFQGNARIIR
jgi:hypothetical protein